MDLRAPLKGDSGLLQAAARAPSERPAQARRRGGRASASPASSSRSSGCHQPSPTGSARGTIVEVEREMGEDMAHGAESVALAAARIAPIARRAARPFRRAGPWPAAAPARPRRRARSTRPRRSDAAARRARRRSGKASGSPLAKAGAIGPQRAVAAARRFRAADGRAEIHHRLDEVAGPIVGHQRQHERARPRRGAAVPAR